MKIANHPKILNQFKNIEVILDYKIMASRSVQRGLKTVVSSK